MDTDYKDLLPAEFAGDSRVWIYQGHRSFTAPEMREVEERLEDFAKNWKSHGAAVKGFAGLFFGQFIILMADETATGVSGCSTDSSVRLLKEIEQSFQVQFFDRLSLAFFLDDKVYLLPLARLSEALEQGLLRKETLYFNNTVRTKAELEEKWIIPLEASWLAQRYLGTRSGQPLGK